MENPISWHGPSVARGGLATDRQLRAKPVYRLPGPFRPGAEGNGGRGLPALGGASSERLIARTSQALTDTPALTAAVSTLPLRLSDSLSVTLALPASSPESPPGS